MKKPILIALFSMLSFAAKAQKSETIKGTPLDTVVYMVVENEPSFPGGSKAYQKYLKNNLKWPDKSGMIDVQGKVFIQFLVEKDGSITHASVVRGLDSQFNSEALKLINNMPKWNPASQNGHIVRAYYTLPIPFILK